MKPSEPRKVTGADGPTGPPAGRQGGTQPASDPSQDLQAARVEAACELMHDAYEAAAVSAGWETQQSSRKPWADVPEANKITMRAAVGALLVHLAAATDRADDAAGLVAGLMAEIQRLKRIGESHGDCRCDTNPETTGGPSEDCPQHGRPIDYWIERGDAVTEQRDVALAEIQWLKKALRCGAEHPENETVVPCILDKGHASQHVSSTGCAGSEVRWPSAVFYALMQRDGALAEVERLRKSWDVHETDCAEVEAQRDAAIAKGADQSAAVLALADRADHHSQLFVAACDQRVREDWEYVTRALRALVTDTAAAEGCGGCAGFTASPEGAWRCARCQQVIPPIISADPAALDRVPWTDCTGAGDCPNAWHIHGCFADVGQCDDPLDHHENLDRVRAEAAEVALEEAAQAIHVKFEGVKLHRIAAWLNECAAIYRTTEPTEEVDQ